jgi:hypothetical protein
MATSGTVVVGQTVDQAHRRMTFEHGRDVDYGNAADEVGRDDFQISRNLDYVLLYVRLHGGDDDILATRPSPSAFVEELERLADARRVAQEDLQLPPASGALGSLHLAQKTLGIRALGVRRLAMRHIAQSYHGRDGMEGPASLPMPSVGLFMRDR